MAELDELERSLALAQIGLAAPPEVKQRVRAKLGGEAMPVGRRGPAEGGIAPALKPGVLSAAARRRIPAWGALALTGLGFAAGYFIGQRPAPHSDPLAIQTRGVRPEPAGAEMARRTETAPRSDARAGDEVPPSAEASPVRSPDEDGASSLPSQDVMRARSGAGIKEVRVKARGTRSTRMPDGLARELALLERAERAIRAGNSDLALALLDELDRDLPKPQLREERQAARLLAECERTGQRIAGSAAPSAATEQARQYLARHPTSVYSERIRTLCGLDVAASNAPSNRPPGTAAQPLAPNGAEGSALGGH